MNFYWLNVYLSDNLKLQFSDMVIEKYYGN